MRILYLAHCLPYPPNKGDKVRAYYALRQLARDHEVHLVAFSKEGEDERELGDLEELCRSVDIFPIDHRRSKIRSLLALLGRRPLTLSYFHSDELMRRVVERARDVEFDAVVAYSSAMAPYALAVDGPPRVLDMVDVDSEKWLQYSRLATGLMRPVYGIEGRRLRRYEKDISSGFDRVALTTAREVELLASIAPADKGVVIKNGVHLDYFRPLTGGRSATPSLVFTGQMDYLPNVDGMIWFAEEVFPALRESHPDLELTIVGRSPTRSIRNLERLAGVRVTGEVADIRPYLSQSWVFVAPLRIAQGIQNKVLEAMAMELPVVVSGQVAAGLADSGFDLGREILVAEAAADWVDTLGDLLVSPEARNEMIADYRRTLAATYSWERNFSGLESVLVEVADRA